MTVDGLAFAFEVGGVEVPAWLPLLPQRYALESAYRAALGFVDGDQGVPSLEPNESDFGAVLAAAVALCWGGPVLELVRYTDTGPTVVRVPPGPRGLRQFGRDVVAFGEASSDALLRRGYALEDVYKAGRACREAMIESIPLQVEVEEAADFIEGPAAGSIAHTSK